MKLPQLRKSKSDAFGSFFLMISTSCLDKPSDKTCSAYPQFQQARRRLTLTAIIAISCLTFGVHPRRWLIADFLFRKTPLRPHLYAGSPVMYSPRINVWMWCVPSYV